MITLSKQLLIGRGGARDVYRHPDDVNKCIKIQRTKGRENEAEISFHKHRLIACFLPKYFGIVETNLGDGVAVELINDYNMTISISAIEIVQLGIMSKNEVKEILYDMYMYFYDKGILIHDSGVQNVLLRKDADDNYHPILIDGFGVKNYSIKYRIRQIFSFLRKYKTKKQALSMLKNIENIKIN